MEALAEYLYRQLEEYKLLWFLERNKEDKKKYKLQIIARIEKYAGDKKAFFMADVVQPVAECGYVFMNKVPNWHYVPPKEDAYLGDTFIASPSEWYKYDGDESFRIIAGDIIKIPFVVETTDKTKRSRHSQ